MLYISKYIIYTCIYYVCLCMRACARMCVYAILYCILPLNTICPMKNIIYDLKSLAQRPSGAHRTVHDLSLTVILVYVTITHHFFFTRIICIPSYFPKKVHFYINNRITKKII